MDNESSQCRNYRCQTGEFLSWHPIILRVNKDEQISGLGEVGLAYGMGYTAAALHLETVIPNFITREHNWQAIKDYHTRLCQQDSQPVKGYYSAPELPGPGLDLKEGGMKDFPTVVVK